jgi:hypothetical protein
MYKYGAVVNLTCLFNRHCFLAQGGVNHQEISEILKKLDTSHTFERRDDLVGANVNVSYNTHSSVVEYIVSSSVSVV